MNQNPVNEDSVNKDSVSEDPVNDGPDNNNSPVNRRFVPAMIAYAVLIGVGAIVLDGLVRKAFLLMMIAFVAKTLIAWKAGW